MTVRTREALILVGVFGVLSVGTMLWRLALRKRRNQSFIMSDFLTMTAIGVLLLHLAMIVIVLVLGNNQFEAPAGDPSAADIDRRYIGSILTITNRVIYNIYLWLQKTIVLLICQRIFAGLLWPERVIKACWIILFASFVAVQATTFVDCQPISLYWQVQPAPGACVEAPIQLLTQGTLNIITDTVLMLLPMPWLLRVRRSWMRRLQLVALFAVSLLLIAMAIIRLPYYVDNTSQSTRYVLGAIESFLAAFVANVPTLYTLRRRNETECADYCSHPATSGHVGGSRRPPRSDQILVTSCVQLEYMVDNEKLPPSRHIVRQDSDERLVGNQPKEWR
ncbi:hypothetical protein BDV25DRAFT_122282 [Aspergillus avenaceus]|uniref:Rhodopsin domain-containing protein n=1 Tax=Aspergillus avenaceus TaxID=36643 RepID=A0A5N6TU58_ASPAV|nr:hypothetical protein BDV25DRAFT_122282 [Aspergillus avenaceus]